MKRISSEISSIVLFASILSTASLFKKKDGIGSPSSWWNNNKMVTIENAFTKQNTAMKANIFFSAGALEGDMMIGPMTAFMDALKSRNYKDLQIASHIFNDETHVAVATACSRTLKVVYG